MLCSDTAHADAAEAAQVMAGCGDWAAEMTRRGVLCEQVGLHPPTDAVTVRVRGGEVLRTDGPFAETKDQIGGYSILECASMRAALQAAVEHPWARYGQIEVRPMLGP